MRAFWNLVESKGAGLIIGVAAVKNVVLRLSVSSKVGSVRRWGIPRMIALARVHAVLITDCGRGSLVR